MPTITWSNKQAAHMFDGHGITVRIADEAIDAIAEQMRVGPSALVGGWMLDRMEDQPLSQPALGVEAIHELAMQLAAELRKVS